MDFLIDLLKTDFASRSDGSCTGWTPEMALVDSIGNVLVGLAYFLIPWALWKPMLRSALIPNKAVRLVFVAFILACGVDHLLMALMNYWPAYRLLVAWQYVTAGVSLSALFVLASALRAFNLRVDIHKREEEEFQERLRQMNQAQGKRNGKARSD